LSKKFIGVVIATYNAEATIIKCIESILSQNFIDFEINVVDGLSTDSTVDLVSNIDDPRVNVVSEKDSGVYDAWNKGARLSKSRWLLFIGADDWLYDNDVFGKFHTKVSGKKDVNNLIAYGQIISESMDGYMNPPRGGRWFNPWSFYGNYIQAQSPLPIMSGFISHTCFKNGFEFDVIYRVVADLDFVLKISRLREPLFLNGLIVSVMGYGGVSSNPKTSLLTLNEVISVRPKNGLSVFNLSLIKIIFRLLLKVSLYGLVGSERVKKIIAFLRFIIGSR